MLSKDKQEEYKPKSTTAKVLIKDPSPFWSGLPLDAVAQIELFSRRGRGRPRATQVQKFEAKTKQRDVTKMRARAKRAINQGKINEAEKIINDMKSKGLLGDRADALNKQLEKLKEVKQMEGVKENVIIEESEKLKNMVVELPQEIDVMPIKETMVLRGAESVKALPPQPLNESEMKSLEEIANEYVKTHKMTPQEAIKKAKKLKVVEQFSSDKEALLAKENQLVFGELSKPKSTTTQSDLQHNFVSVDKSKPTQEKSKTTIPYSKMPKQLRNDLRVYLRDNFDLVPDYDETEFVMDNFVNDDIKQRLVQGDIRTGNTIGEIIKNARQTQQFVPKDIEGNDDMSKEERQVLFHKLMIENKRKQESVEKTKTNFDNYDKMSGGVNAGLETKTKKNEESTPIKLPDEFKDYEFILDSKIKDNAISREMFKGIDPNAIIDSGNEELMNAYFAKMNELSNQQDNKEINEAIENIEILSGGNKDTLFGATDLLTTRKNVNMKFNQDLPDNIADNPAPIERGRDAQTIEEVDVDAINREDRLDYVTTIASGIGVLANTYRGIFGKNDIPASRGQNDILEDINQNIRLLGKRGIYGDDKSLKIDDELYEGTTLQKRLSSLREFRNQRILGEKNPQTMGQHSEAVQDDDAIRQALMFNRGAGGAQGASLQQLRQQEFAYKQANRRVAHDGRAFIRGGRSTQIQLENEFEP